jgi:hypothetical protein
MPAVTVTLFDIAALESPAARAKGTVRPSDIPVTMLQIRPLAVKCPRGAQCSSRPLALSLYVAIDGQQAAALNHKRKGDADRQKVKLDSLALLSAKPIHEKAMLRMNHHDRHDHVCAYAQRRDAREAAKDEPKRTGKFGRDGKKSECNRNVHLLGEKLHRARKAVAAEPAEDFLRAVREEYRTKEKTKNQRPKTATSSND